MFACKHDINGLNFDFHKKKMLWYFCPFMHLLYLFTTKSFSFLILNVSFSSLSTELHPVLPYKTCKMRVFFTVLILHDSGYAFRFLYYMRQSTLQYKQALFESEFAKSWYFCKTFTVVKVLIFFKLKPV